MRLRNVGTTLVLTIPKALVGAMGWQEGDQLHVEVLGKNALKVSRKED